jgi:hypothetical protein
MQRQNRAIKKKHFYRLNLFAFLVICFFFCSCQSVKVTGSYSSNQFNVVDGQNTIKLEYTTKYKKICVKLSSQIVSEMDSILKGKPATSMNSVEIFFW